MSDLVDRAIAAAARRQDEVLPVLERWVRQNSFSENLAGVAAVGNMLAEDFAIAGLALTRHPGDTVGDHLVWCTPAWDAQPDARQLLVGHHDTVFPPGTFEVWERNGDILRGPGVLDMKGGLVVIRAAFMALADIGVLAGLPLSLVSVSDEEIGSRHSYDMLQKHARGARAALVFEAGRTTDAIVTRRKGTGRITITAHGKAAHAGNNHQDGINAITALARLVARAHDHTDYDAGLTINVGLFSGGTSANTVPAEATTTIDFRYTHRQDGEELMASLGRAADEIASQTGARFSFTGGIRRAPLEKTAASQALYERYAACARAVGLGDGECPLIGGGSDANTVSEVGVPAIDGLGPRGRGFHTHDEIIEIPTLALRTQALLRYLLTTWSERDDERRVRP